MVVDGIETAELYVGREFCVIERMRFCRNRRSSTGTALFDCNSKRTLKELNYNVKGILELVLADNEIISLVGLQYFEGLRILDLSYNRIGNINCYYSQIETLRFLPHVITKLNISHNKILQLLGLEKLVNLSELDASFNQISDMSGLLPNIRLRNLNLSNNQIKQVEFIETLTVLER